MKRLLKTILELTLKILVIIFLIILSFALMSCMLWVFWNDGIRHAFALPYVTIQNCIIITVFGTNIILFIKLCIRQLTCSKSDK